MSWKKGFGRRLKLYGLGLGLGSLLAWALVWRNHSEGPAMWPAAKIRESIRNSVFLADSASLTLLQQVGLKPEQLSAWVDSSNVQISKSEPQRSPRIYFLENQSETIGIRVEIQDSTCRILSTEFLN
ncbi:MAG: hypothetical protein ACOYK5_03860 [Bacteroidia bacterium]|jgi:hypothetical protein